MRSRVLIAAALAALVAVVLVRAGGEDHEIHATFDSAVQLVPGARVTAAGMKVGTVSAVRLRDGQADVTLRIDDEAIRPLRRGTRATIRWGGTASYANRYVEIAPGPVGAPPLADGARLATTNTVTPVEIDDVLAVFDEDARRGLGGLVDGGAATFARRGPALRDGLASAGPAFAEASELFDDLGADTFALRSLVVAGAGTAAAVAEKEADLRALVDAAGRTFAEIAVNAAAAQRTLADMPGTLRVARGTLRRTDGVLGDADRLVGALRPGGRELRRLSTPLGAALTTLRGVAPELDRTLVALGRAAPPTTAFLDEARPLARRLEPVLRRTAPMVACIRPYAPEIAGFLTSWAGIGSSYDAQGHYGRVMLQSFPFPNATPVSAAEIQKLTPGLGYALIRPPGFGAAGEPGATWLQPQCGAGADGLDPTKERTP